MEWTKCMIYNEETERGVFLIKVLIKKFEESQNNKIFFSNPFSVGSGYSEHYNCLGKRKVGR